MEIVYFFAIISSIISGGRIVFDREYCPNISEVVLAIGMIASVVYGFLKVL